jgi:hypothetical protein
MTPTIDLSFDAAGDAAKRVAEIFSVSGEELEERMQKLAAAALAEYELAFSGERFPSTMKDLRELRLRLLYDHLPDGEPTDDQVAQLFQLTRTQAGTLIAGTRARFGPDIEGRIKREAKKALSESTKVNKDKVAILAPDSLARYLNDLVAKTHAPPLDKRRDATQTYYVGRTTIEVLCEALGLDPTAVNAIEWS